MAFAFEPVVKPVKAEKKDRKPTDDEESRKDLLEAVSRLDQGQIKASIAAAADAINRMAAKHGVHGYASY